MFVKFRQMLDVPASYRAYRPKTRTKKSSSPVPLEILSRKYELEKAGISPVLQYHKESDTYFLQYNSKTPVKWNSSRSAVDAWREAVGL